ncbi:soluble quino protein glucose/sorbosone dehydrogenase [Colletotrichum phormii]|uniref:Soluble quino protein glucose/sorbosone dehydrogenase n=1 Tax=Colletotrichum phormii TaxID=359342 RepID=A0AAJ0ELE9_9PEZI|nr:soluble quino protein glucose/sorbosone dehydrogenase [Colletotrichum phormii]KAK1640991.1 soluble quino protein glucose/sorbosone dehydrogenase [Colletotrichum phormii]
MAPITSFAAVAAAGAALFSTVAAQCANLTPVAQPQLAPGYTSKLILNGLSRPRSLQFDTLGNLLIAEQGGTGVKYVKLTGNGGVNVCVASQKTLISNANLAHGLALSADGKTIYAATASEVLAYSYDAAAGTVGQARSIINGMTQTGHQSRTLLIPKDKPNVLLVSRGSAPNLDLPTAEAASGRSQIRAFDLTKLTGSAVNYTTGELFGWGLRNSVGVGENPLDGGIWSVENSLDNMDRNSVDIHNDNPGEELNYHGSYRAASNPQKGANYGYPNCFAVWETSTVTGVPNVKVGSQVIQGNASGSVTDQYCQTVPTPPRLTFQAHMAPLDVKFSPNGSSAYISFHGSWNRSPGDGYRLSRVDFGANGQPLAASTSKTAEVEVAWNVNNAVCPGSCFRPVGLAFDKKGRLFMLSDSTGELFVLTVPA